LRDLRDLRDLRANIRGVGKKTRSEGLRAKYMRGGDLVFLD
jgi:hypothetical protein